MTGNRTGHSLQLDIGFLELFTSAYTQANTEANTCAYLSLMRLGGSSITSDQQSLSVFDETSSYLYYLVVPGQPTMQYYSISD